MRKQDYNEFIYEPLDEENGGMKIRTTEEINIKKEDFRQVRMFNVDKAI